LTASDNLSGITPILRGETLRRDYCAGIVAPGSLSLDKRALKLGDCVVRVGFVHVSAE
jgi:hypothetical protein